VNIFRTLGSKVPAPEQALPGRDEPIAVPERHLVLGTPLLPPFPEGVEHILVGMGCFWGAERLFWQLPGVYTTAVGYAGGSTQNPTYREVCSGRTGHAEVVLVAYRPAELPLAELLRTFWEEHDPTQGMRQGNDVGTQYRSAIYYTSPEQRDIVIASRDAYQAALSARQRGQITTEIAEAGPFYLAEEYHQQYLEKRGQATCRIPG
jgi:peptide-methionine (S)-S-oxide reductase